MLLVRIRFNSCHIIKINQIIGLLLIVGTIPLSFARTISLEEYLRQVKTANLSLQSAAATIEATRQRENSSDMLKTPEIFGEVAHILDEKPPESLLSGKKMDAMRYELGVKKLWSFGLQSQLSYHLTKAEVTRDSLPFPLTALNDSGNISQARTQLDLVQPLWKNWLGREYDFMRESTQSQLQMQRQAEEFKIKMMLAQAEFTYWQLALASEYVRTQEAALLRFQRIRDWVQNRVKNSLADRADLLQAESGIKVRRMELELAEHDRSSLQRNFNSLRGVKGDRLDGEVLPISSRMLSDMYVANGAIKRLDIDVARASERIAEVNVQQSREKFKPSIDVFGSYAMNSQNEKFSTAASDAFKPEKPTVIIGIQFSSPLDRELINRERNGLIKLSDSSKSERELKEFSARQEWEELLRQLSDAKTRLQLANEIETVQKQKLDYERIRLERGRTTSYQIMLFEQDYANAQLGAIKSKAEILGIMAKLKTFGDAV